MDEQLSLVMSAQERWLEHNSAEAHHQCETCAWYEERYWSDETTEQERRLLDEGLAVDGLD